MAVLLGKAGVLAVDPDKVEIALRDHVVNPEADVHATIIFSVGTDRINGELRVEPVIVEEVSTEVFVSPVAVYPIKYSGLIAEKFSLILQAPKKAGVYRVTYYSENNAEPSGEDELFVQLLSN